MSCAGLSSFGVGWDLVFVNPIMRKAAPLIIFNLAEEPIAVDTTECS